MRALPVRLYAAIPARVFGGNIAGVAYDEVSLTQDEMQGIAAEIGAPTTRFVRRCDGATFDVRFFSTRSEMEMCGHVTIGILASLFEDKLILQGAAEYRQVTLASEISMSVANETGAPHISMKQLPPHFNPIHVESTEVAPMLGFPARRSNQSARHLLR